MALLDDVKTACRVSGSAFNDEINAYINAAISDMQMKGVDPTIVTTNATGLPKVAIINYCKAMLGYDNDEASRFLEIYRNIVCDLLNSCNNIACIER